MRKNIYNFYYRNIKYTNTTIFLVVFIFFQFIYGNYNTNQNKNDTNNDYYIKKLKDEIISLKKEIENNNEKIKQYEAEINNKKQEYKNNKIAIYKVQNDELIQQNKYIKIKNIDNKSEVKNIYLGKSKSENNIIYSNSSKNILNKYDKNILNIGKNIESYELYWPTKSKNISSQFGDRIHPILNKEKLHRGIDIVGKIGDEVISSVNGVITHANEKGSYGNLIEIERKDGLKVRYAHLSKIDVAIGQEVYEGEKIGEIGITGMSIGPHLHYEVLIEEIPVNPIKFKYIND